MKEKGLKESEASPRVRKRMMVVVKVLAD